MTSDQTNNYDDLSELYEELLSFWSRYMGHVSRNIGGVYEHNKKPTQKGVVYSQYNKKRKKKRWFDRKKMLLKPKVD